MAMELPKGAAGLTQSTEHPRGSQQALVVFVAGLIGEPASR